MWKNCETPDSLCACFSDRVTCMEKKWRNSTDAFWRTNFSKIVYFRNETSRNNAKYQERHAAKILEKLFCILWWYDFTPYKFGVISIIIDGERIFWMKSTLFETLSLSPTLKLFVFEKICINCGNGLTQGIVNKWFGINLHKTHFAGQILWKQLI